MNEEISGNDKTTLENLIAQYKLRYKVEPNAKEIVINETVYEKREGKWFRKGPYVSPITKREIKAYERGEKRLRDIANSRPILNPNGPTPLIPGEKES